MGDLDIDRLLSALDNEDNETMIGLTFEKISASKNNVLQRLHLPTSDLKKMHSKLKKYRFIDELPELKYGSYIRWIPLKDPENIRLTNGGVVVEMKVCDEGIVVTCRNNMHRMFSIKLQENLVFQKLSEQESVLLSALSYLEN